MSDKLCSVTTQRWRVAFFFIIIFYFIIFFPRVEQIVYSRISLIYGFLESSLNLPSGLKISTLQDFLVNS